MAKPGTGPIPARVMIVGECWGAEEERAGEPFVGVSGQELNRMLHDSGLMRSECYVTNLVNARPYNNDLGQWFAFKKKDRTPAHVQLCDKWVLPLVKDGYDGLLMEIATVKPQVIICVGNAAMWALTGKWGVVKWRGSILKYTPEEPVAGPNQVIINERPYVIPTYHPAAVLRQWDWRHVAVEDFRRAKRIVDGERPTKPEWKFQLRPSFAQVTQQLSLLVPSSDSPELWLDFDLETRAGHIACAGISWSRTEALCIPFMCLETREGYWSIDEETEIIYLLYKLLTHPRVKVRGQNLLYDCQYTYKHWHFVPRVAQDTMVSQHSLFCTMPKALHFQASMYCDWYVYWKDEGKSWEEDMNEEDFWYYNCEDCVYTREVGEVELQTADKLGLRAVHDFQQELFWPVLQAMQRGSRILPEQKKLLAKDLMAAMQDRENFIREILGHDLNISSPLQMRKLFYEDLRQPPIMTRPKKGIPGHLTCDDEALTKIALREPLLKPLCTAIADLRTLGIFNKSFVLMKLDEDGRARCSYNIGGSESGESAPKTFRLSSSKSAFDSGANLQTIPSDKSKSVGKAAARGQVGIDVEDFKFPNVRSIFGPDPGYEFFDMDLDRADLHVFVWEIEDKLYKELLQKQVDAHLFHVYLLDNQEPPPLDELVETHPKYPDHRGPRKHKREFSKVFCHATDYVGSPRTVAAHTGRTVHEIERARKRYLAIHPKIEPYWADLGEQVRKRRYVENKFGYRWYIFDRMDTILPEIVAWLPQSTVGAVINRVWMNIYKNLPEVWVLLQVHDSLAGQFPIHKKVECLERLQEESKIVIPYPDPLIIPVGIKTSTVSWGDCK